MRKVFLIAGLMTAFAVAVVASSAAANFAGTWTLDKTKSQGLSPRLAGADKVTWTITQDAATISIDSKVEGGQPPAGGGGGMGGGRPPAGPTAYKLDGTEVTSDVNFGQATGKQTLGGLVHDCRIAGDIETDEGRLGDQAVAIIPIEMMSRDSASDMLITTLLRRGTRNRFSILSSRISAGAISLS